MLKEIYEYWKKINTTFSFKQEFVLNRNEIIIFRCSHFYIKLILSKHGIIIMCECSNTSAFINNQL